MANCRAAVEGAASWRSRFFAGFDVEKKFPYHACVTKLYGHRNWHIRVFGNEHPPVHAHVLHPDGKAVIWLDGTVKNRGVPADVVKLAVAWIAANADIVRSEWVRLDNPEKR